MPRIDTDKVLGFLDLFGSWDASLGLVMGMAAFAYAERNFAMQHR